MSVAQILRNTPAAVPLQSAAAGPAFVNSTTAPGVVGGLAIQSTVQGSDTWFSQQATLPAAAAGVGAAGDTFAFRQSVGGNATGAGGVASGRLQWFSYKNGAFESQILQSGVPGAADQDILYHNRGLLDTTRCGATPALALGANVINVPSANLTSVVRLRIAGTTAAGGFPASAIPVPAVATAAGSFTITALAAHVGIIYDYEVIA